MSDDLKEFSLTEISILIRILDLITENELLNDTIIEQIIVEKGSQMLTYLEYQPHQLSQIVQTFPKILEKTRKVYSLKNILIIIF